MKQVNWLLSLTLLYAALVAAISIVNYTGADRTWIGALNLYLPQLMWAVPGVALAILLFKVNRSWSWLPLLCVLWVLGPVMDWKFNSKSADAAGAPRLRVMTWNIKYGSYSIAPLVEEVARFHPDVVFFQDASGWTPGPLQDYFKDWQVRTRGQYVIASRYPLSEAEQIELPYFGYRKESFLRCRMDLGSTTVSLYNLHLKTPRRSLNAFRTARKRPWYLPDAIERFNHNVRTRYLQSLAVAEHLKSERGPVIVAGDLNSPDSSLVCAALREAGLHDAFAERGTGYGYTYGQLLLQHRLPWVQLSWMRIDHIMPSSHFETEHCETGTGRASDHRPVVADLALKGAGTSP